MPGNPQNPGNQEQILQKSMIILTSAYYFTQKVECFGPVKLFRLIISISIDDISLKREGGRFQRRRNSSTTFQNDFKPPTGYRRVVE